MKTTSFSYLQYFILNKRRNGGRIYQAHNKTQQRAPAVLDNSFAVAAVLGRYVFGLHHRHRLHLLVSPLHDRVRIDGESDHILRLQEAINEL